jgi:hypothetical protein
MMVEERVNFHTCGLKKLRLLFVHLNVPAQPINLNPVCILIMFAIQGLQLGGIESQINERSNSMIVQSRYRLWQAVFVRAIFDLF